MSVGSVRAFHHDPEVASAWVRSSSLIAQRAASDDYIDCLPNAATVRDVVDFCITGHNQDCGPLSYEQLGIPDRLILLAFSIARRLPETSRGVWLGEFFLYIPRGADLEKMGTWRWFLLRLLGSSLPAAPHAPGDDATERILREAASAAANVVGLLYLEDPAYRGDTWGPAHRRVTQARKNVSALIESGQKERSLPPALAMTALARRIMELSTMMTTGALCIWPEAFVEAATEAVPIQTQASILLEVIKGVRY